MQKNQPDLQTGESVISGSGLNLVMSTHLVILFICHQTVLSWIPLFFTSFTSSAPHLKQLTFLGAWTFRLALPSCPLTSSHLLLPAHQVICTVHRPPPLPDFEGGPLWRDRPSSPGDLAELSPGAFQPVLENGQEPSSRQPLFLLVDHPATFLFLLSFATNYLKMCSRFEVSLPNPHPHHNFLVCGSTAVPPAVPTKVTMTSFC